VEVVERVHSTSASSDDDLEGFAHVEVREDSPAVGDVKKQEEPINCRSTENIGTIGIGVFASSASCSCRFRNRCQLQLPPMPPPPPPVAKYSRVSLESLERAQVVAPKGLCC